MHVLKYEYTQIKLYDDRKTTTSKHTLCHEGNDGNASAAAH